MARLPLFPLDLVLFPGSQASLHIFEERYRAMLRDVLAVDGRFGIIVPTEGASPTPGSIGVCAQVVSHQLLPDGRSNLVVRGDSRFVLRYLREEAAPYLVGEVEFFEDDVPGEPLDADSERLLRALAARCRRAMATLADATIDNNWHSDPALLTFEVAAGLPWDAAQALPLLAMRSMTERAALLLRILPGVVPELEQRATVHQRAGSNGKGPDGRAVGTP